MSALCDFRSLCLPTAELWEDFIFLCLLGGCATDLSNRTLPNRLCAAAWAGGILYGLHVGGPTGAAQALQASGLGCALTMLLYLGRAVAAGDVKFFAAISTFLPPSSVTPALASALIFGGLLALGLVLVHAPPPAAERHGRHPRWRPRLQARWQRSGSLLCAAAGGSGRSPPDILVPYALALSLGVWVLRRFPDLYG